MGVSLNPFTGQLQLNVATSGSGNTIAPYPNRAAFPAVTSANNGQFAVALDTGIVYEVIAGAWAVIAGPSDILSVGTIDSNGASANGASDLSNQLIMQSASATAPGLVNNTTQTLGSGTKTVDNLISSGLTASTALTANASKQLVSSSTTDTELGYVHGVTSAIQTQLNAKQSTTLTNAHILVGNGSNVATDVAVSGDLTLANTGAFSISATSNATLTNLSALTTASSLATVGTITSGTWNATTLAVNHGGTGQVTAPAAFNALSPITTTGDMIYSPAGATSQRLAIGSTGNVLTVTGGVPTWAPPATSGTVTAVSVATANGFAGTSSGGATPALTLTTTVNAPVLAGNATAISAASTTGSGSVVVLSTGPTMTNPVVGTQAQGDGSTKAASTSYVDVAVANALAGVNPAVAVQAATTAAGDTSGFTYNNGVSGIGATFTGTTNTAITIDGFTFTTLGQRLLVKNDTQSPSGAFNGVYYVTQVQTGILPPILTRALDYDTPSDMNNTGAIPVINGTVNTTTSWVLTSLVVTVGTTPLTFVEFTRNPADYLLKANNLSDVASKSTSFNNLSPMTTGGDLIYGGASGAATRLANGNSGQVLTSGGTTAAPTWQTPTIGTVTSVALSVPPTSIFGVSGSPITTSGTLGLTTTGTSGGIPYFSSTSTLSTSALLTQFGVIYGGGAAATPVATAAGTTGQALVATTSSAPTWGTVGTAGVNTATFTAPTRQVFTSGTAATYTTPTSPRSPLYIKIRIAGGGGGGGGSGTGSFGTAGNGGTTTFSGGTLSASGGNGGGQSGNANGGAASGGNVINIAGGIAQGASYLNSTGATQPETAGGSGGSSLLGNGGGGGAYGVAGGTGNGYGAGGGGGGGALVSGFFCGGGGGGGGYVEHVISSPAATYTYTVGAAGTDGGGGAGGGLNGGNGSSGVIIVDEFYQ